MGIQFQFASISASSRSFAVAAIGFAFACSTPPAGEDSDDARASAAPPAAGVAEQSMAAANAPAAAAQWVDRAPLPERRTEVSATTDGTFIYLAGGFGPPEGAGRASAPRTLWRYDPGADRWTDLTQIPEGVNHAPFQYYDGRLYILGGFREATFEPIGSVRIYDLASGEWTEGSPMPTARGASGWAVLDGRIHILGGNAAEDAQLDDHPDIEVTGDRSVNVHEAYDPASDSWTTLAPMPTPRNHLGATSLEGRIYALLGRSDGDFTMTTHEIYDAEADAWSTGPAVPTGRSGVAVVARDGAIFAFGGEMMEEDERRTFDDAERFDPATNEWERIEPMPTSRHGLGAAPVGSRIYVISGGPDPGFTFSNVNEALDLGSLRR